MINILFSAPGYIYSSLFQSLGIRKDGQKLPNSVGKYKLISSLSRKNYPFQIGLYKDKQLRVIVKIWTGNRNSVHYQALKHEAEVLNILGNAVHRISKVNVEFPRPIRTIVRGNRIMLICTYQPGIKLSTLPLSQQIASYKECRKFLKALTNVLTYKEMQIIGIRGYRFYIISAPIITGIAMVRRPLMAPVLAFALLRFYTSAFHLKRQHLVLVHGDLHVENIIKNNKKISIIDFEQLRVSYKELEDVTTLASTRNPIGFEKVLWMKTKHLKKSGRIRFSLLMIHTNIFNLIGNMQKKSVSRYKRLLNKSI